MSAITGRQIFKKISYDSDFISKAKLFEEHRSVTFSTKKEAIEFLTLYLVLLSTGEHSDYNENRLLDTYEKINTLLTQNNCINSHDFLSSFDKDIHYTLVKEKICSS